MSSFSFMIDGFDSLMAAADEAELFKAFDAVMAEFGGLGFAVASLPEATRMIVSYSQGLNGWAEHYIEHGMAASCAVSARIAEAITPFLWSQVRREAERPEQRAVFEAAEAFGIKDGIIVPVRSHDGLKGDVFVRMEAGALTPEVQKTVALLALAFHSHLLVLRTGPVPHGKPLSGRERDVLNWFAAGKSAQDVADIMGITAGTVMFHYRNVSDRYGTLTRTHTVVEAIRRGAITVGCEPPNEPGLKAT